VERLAKSIEVHVIANEWPRVLALLPELTPALTEAAEALARGRAAGMFEALPPIAVVAADPLERTLVHAALAERYDLTDHASGDSALAALRHEAYGAVVLSAVSAHGMSTAALVRVLRETVSLRHLPVVALVNPGDEPAYRALGVDACVSSAPVDAAHLRALVDRLLREGRAEPCSCEVSRG
jgi:CheY-like chemotaxis protein